MTRSPPTICLNMIVKDESHLIRGTLEMLCSKLRFDYWVICDTGSSDNTRETIAKFFTEKNIPGELHCDAWVDFGHNRTLALERAFNKTDLLLVFDADDEIHGTIPIPREVAFDEYHLHFGVPKSGMNYTRTQLINNRKRFKYLSVLHEFISCQEASPARVCILNGDYYLISGRSGSRNKDPNKYLKDAAILATAHAVALAKGDDLYKRYAFYCANSYRDCGRHEDAIKWYKITLSQDNWAQEKYLSCLYMHQCYEALGQPDHGYFYLVKAFSYDNERVECLHPLIVHYCCENMNEIAYNYYRMVKMTTPPNNAGKLFVETDKAGFYVPYYMVIVADRVGDRECGIRMYEIIFKEKHRTFSPWHLRNLFHNLRFFINHVKPDALNAFTALANDYLKFVIENGVPVSTFENLDIGMNPPPSPPPHKEKIKGKCAFKNSRNILFYAGHCNAHWNYSKMKHGALGGSEKAVAHLSKELGFKLNGGTVYVAGDVCAEELAEFNVVYVPMKDLPELLKKTDFHTVICSRYISFLELYGNACSFYQFYIWGHDTRLLSYGCNLGDGAIIRKWAECIDGCVCQTQWHADQYIQLYPELKPKMKTINNGIDLELFPASASTPKQAGKFVYTSRTERGLARVLDLWSEVVAALPCATLVVSTYEAFPCNDDERRIEARIESLNQAFPGNRIQHVGKLNPTQLYAELSTAEYWLYPTNWPETSCITAMEMLMSGVICLYYPIAGLTDTMNGCGVQITPGSEIQTLRELAHDEERKEALRKEGRAYAESCSWATRANAWKQTIFQTRVAIFNSFPFHYEMFGHILDHFLRSNDASTVVSIFTETRNELGWLEFYKTQFKNLNIQFKPVSDFCDARHAFDLIFVPTDDDFAFKREWIDGRCIASEHDVSIRRPEYAHRIGVRPFAESDKQWTLPCCEFVSVNEKLRHLEPDCIHVAICGALDYMFNHEAFNRLYSSVPLHVHFIGRKIIDLRPKIKEGIVVHLHEKMKTRDMIELLKKCDYVMTDLLERNESSMSGSVPLAFSTLATLIISKQNNRIYGFKNVVEFELNADDRIVLSKPDDKDIDQLKVERDGLIAMYDDAICAISAANVASKSKKIIDCFIFYNELNMLAYRLHALNSVVDYFVIVEARQTHVGASKPLHFEENKRDPRFAQYSDKIIHIIVDLPHTQEAMNVDISQNHQWVNENFQRNCISKGIDELASRLNAHDIIVVADLDEIPDPATLAKMKEHRFSLNAVLALEQDFYYYNLKCKNAMKWPLCKVIAFKTYKEMNVSFETIRQSKGGKIERGGWHMSYFGDAKFIKNKIENFSHQEHNLEHITNVDAIQKRMDEGIDLYMRPGETFERIAICDNDYLPPFYETHLSSFI